jgi:hypothetical protein
MTTDGTYLGRKPFVYKVQLQTAMGELVEKLYSVFWSPEKTDSSMVAHSCAIEETLKHGFDQAHNPIKAHLPLRADLVTD